MTAPTHARALEIVAVLRRHAPALAPEIEEYIAAAEQVERERDMWKRQATAAFDMYTEILNALDFGPTPREWCEKHGANTPHPFALKKVAKLERLAAVQREHGPHVLKALHAMPDEGQGVRDCTECDAAAKAIAEVLK